MSEELFKNRILLWIAMLFVSFQISAQSSYNIVMNIPQNPKTQMNFNWFTGVGITGEQVQIMLGNTITAPATYILLTLKNL